MFTKRHYEAVARMIKETELKHPESREAMNQLIMELTPYFREDNPHFDAVRFLHATIATTRPAVMLAAIVERKPGQEFSHDLKAEFHQLLT